MNAPVKLATALAVALAITACSKEEPKKVEAPKPAEPPSVTVTIAHAGPLTGSIAHLGKDDENGVRLAVDQTNAKKITIDGKVLKINMISEDDQADPKVGTTVAQKIIDAKAVAVIGHLNSGTSIPASEIYAKAGVPMISGSATNPTLTERGLKTVYRTVGRDDQQGPAIAAYIATLKSPQPLAAIDDSIDRASIARGAKIFSSRSCNDCHAAPTYTSPETYDVGLVDELGEKRFNPPSLRGVSHRSPLLHNKRARTIEEVFEQVKHPNSAEYSADEVRDLAAFLRSL